MNNSNSQIGIDRIISLDWLEKISTLILAGNNRETIVDIFQQELKHKLSGGKPGVRGSREKTITILINIWLSGRKSNKVFQTEGLQLIQKLRKEYHIALHWCMTMVAYPFWGSVASYTGRLLRLQGTATAAHIQRRIKEEYGERETASRAAQRVLRSFVAWGVLKETDNKGVYTHGKQYAIEDPRLMAWMIEACLRIKESGSASLIELISDPSVFPFSTANISAERVAATSSRLDVVRHGLDHDLMILTNTASKDGN